MSSAFPFRSGALLKALLALSGLHLFAGCSTPARLPTARQLDSDTYATLYLGQDGQIVSKRTKAGKMQAGGWWKGDGLSGPSSIVINLSTQEAFFYKSGLLVGMSPISSGREGYGTPSGRFSIIEKDPDHLSNLYGDYVDDTGRVVVAHVGVLEDPRPPGTHFRGAPMPYFMRITAGVGMHEGFLPGVPDSHGCIRLPGNMARIFFQHASEGTPVTVSR